MVMTRIEIINESKEMLAPAAVSLRLTNQYDWVLKEITSRFPLLRNQQKKGTLTVSQNYIILPPNFAFPELFKVDGSEVTYVEPEEWVSDYDESDDDGTPTIWTTLKPGNKLYMHVPPSTAWDYILYYTGVHPKAGRTLAYTSGGTYEIKSGVTITGATSSATGVVDFITLTSGTFAAGTAAGKMILSSQSGTFGSSENLNVGSNTNVATVSGDSSIEDNFLHLLGDDFDEVIITGVAARACLRVVPVQMEKYVMINDLFQSALLLQGHRYGIRHQNPSYIDF